MQRHQVKALIPVSPNRKKHPSIPSRPVQSILGLKTPFWILFDAAMAPRSKYPTRPSLEHLVLCQSPWCTGFHTKKRLWSREPFESLLLKKESHCSIREISFEPPFGCLKHLKAGGKSWSNIGVSSCDAPFFLSNNLFLFGIPFSIFPSARSLVVFGVRHFCSGIHADFSNISM